jgi:RimJ/RimL family protein N-acetyltransferase
VGDASSSPPPSLSLLDRLEEWIYRLNEEQHWIFRLYDRFNELWARSMFRGVRARASRLDLVVSVKDCRARVRFLTLRDEDTFAEFLSRLDVFYLPPHPLDRRSAGVALRRRSYIPIGIFVEGELIGYILLRIFFFRRAVTGIWMLASTHGSGIGRHTLYESVKFLEQEGLPNYCTIPIGNEPSLRIAHWCGWRIIRTNRFFNVLKVISEAGEDLR